MEISQDYFFKEHARASNISENNSLTGTKGGSESSAILPTAPLEIWLLLVLIITLPFLCVALEVDREMIGMRLIFVHPNVQHAVKLRVFWRIRNECPFWFEGRSYFGLFYLARHEQVLYALGGVNGTAVLLTVYLGFSAPLAFGFPFLQLFPLWLPSYLPYVYGGILIVPPVVRCARGKVVSKAPGERTWTSKM